MKSKYFVFPLSVAAIAIFLISGSPSVSTSEAAEPIKHAEPIKWRIQTALTAGSMYFGLVQKFAERIDKMSGGRLKTEVLPDGAVVGFFEILDAVDKGVVEGGMAWTHFWSGKHPAAYLFSDQPTIGGMDQLGYLAWYYDGDGYKLYNEFYRDVLKVNVVGFIMQVSGGQPLGWFKKPIYSLADFQKLKYRSPPGLTGELFTEMGISAVALPGAELIPAAQKGIIDAGEWLGPGEDIKLGLYQVWKHYYLQGFHQASDLGEVLINKDFWNKLSPDLQAIIEGSARASIVEAISKNIYGHAKGLKELVEKHGVIVHKTPKDLYPEFLRASEVVVAKYSAKDPFFKKVVDNQRAFAALIVPYWTDMLGLYVALGEAALKKK